METRCLQTQGEGAEPGTWEGFPADSSPAGTDFTNRQDLGVLGMAVGSTCLPTGGVLISGEQMKGQGASLPRDSAPALMLTARLADGHYQPAWD